MLQARHFYQSYLLRLWYEPEQTAWRASLEHIQTRQLYLFASPEAMMSYLYEQTANAADTPIGKGESHESNG